MVSDPLPPTRGRAGVGGWLQISLALVALIILLVLAGCGFRPMYGTRSTDPKVAAELTDIYVEPIPDREGQMVRNAIVVRLNPNGRERDPRYRLQVVISVVEAQTILATDQTATRANVTYGTTYELFEGNTLLTQGNFVRDFSYDYLNEQYSNISARVDVGRRASDEIAVEVRNRMAAYFIRALKARTAGAEPAPAPVTGQ
jgi:LPS-assembly lipoprotein